MPINSVRYFDVESKEDLPTAEAGHRYLDFLGGARHLRCYLVPYETVRAEFMETIPDLDECHEPVFRHRGLTVRQDASYALPGLFIVSFEAHYPALDDVGEITTILSAMLIRDVRLGMRHALGIEHIHLLYEEKAEESCQVHYWMVPVPSRRGDSSTGLTRLNLRQYLSSFRFQDQRDTILDHNARLRAFLETAGSAARIDAMADRAAATRDRDLAD